MIEPRTERTHNRKQQQNDELLNLLALGDFFEEFADPDDGYLERLGRRLDI